jgi:hypothetical protein
LADLQDRLQQALGTAYRLERELGGGGMSRVFLNPRFEWYVSQPIVTP